ncbi:MAG: hypothetical protein GF401_10235 [Chitinivibrionales bacterium]|nr:hypothetical protein [Chitinivibrionales bacterium]
MVKNACLITALLWIAAVAGPNQDATISIDMDPSTAGIQNTLSSDAGTFWVFVTAGAVKNLDTYSFRMTYNTDSLEFISASWSYAGTNNILTLNGGSTIGQSAPDTLDGSPDTVEGWLTLIGDDTLQAPDGSGLLAAIQFRSLLGPLNSTAIRSALGDFVDSDGERDLVASGNLFSGSYTFTPTFTINASAGTKGSISPNGTVNVTYGIDQSFTVTADDANGYVIDQLLVDGLPIAAAAGVSSYVHAFTNVTANQAISASFVLRTHTITASADPNGSITPNGTVNVTYGNDQSFTVTADDANGYVIDQLLVDGSPVTAAAGVSSYVHAFTNVTANQTISASFALRTHTIIASAGSNGSITPSGTVNVTYGIDQLFTVTADDANGYVIDQLLVDNVAVGAASQASSYIYSFTNVTANHTISAGFTLDNYSLTINVSGAGTVTKNPDKTSYAHNESVLLAAAPGSAGWYFKEWQNSPINGYKNPSQTIIMDQSYSITAVFEPGGDITVELPNTGGNADVFLFASSGMNGSKKLDGPGTIDSVIPGNHLLCVVEQGFRPEYKPVLVQSGITTAVSVSQRPVVPFVFDTTKAVSSGGTPIQTGSYNSAAMEDMDNDGDMDLLIGRGNGTFDYYANSGTDYVSATDPRNGTGSDLVLSGGIVCLRVVDWNADGKFDLLVSNNNNTITLFKNISYDNELVYDNGTVLYTSTGNITGFDLSLENSDEYPDLVMGLDDGSVMVAYAQTPFDWNAPSWATATNLATSSGNIVAGFDAAPCMMDLSGDGANDLLVGNAAGDVLYFRNRNDGTYQEMGVMYSAGQPLSAGGGAAIGKKYGDENDFLSIALSDGNGQVYTAQGWLRADFNHDGTVRVEDLSIFGDTWHLEQTDTDWEWITNLNLNADAGSGNQIIDVQDLSIFGDSWHKEK